MSDQQLIARYVRAFASFEELCVETPVAESLATGELNDWSQPLWRPVKYVTNRSALDAVYQHLPGRFPNLFEELLLTYRWADVELDRYRLLANPPGEGLSGLLHAIQHDQIMFGVLSANRYLQFARGGGDSYDPVCFDLSRRFKGDCPIVRLDHEFILCNERIVVTKELAETFRELMIETIERAKSQ